MDDANPISMSPPMVARSSHGPAPPVQITIPPAQPALTWNTSADELLDAIRHQTLGLTSGTTPAELEHRLLQMHQLITLGQITSEVAHDFNNLMTVVLGFSELLLSAGARDEIDIQHLSALHWAAERAAGLTGQLLGYTRGLRPESKAFDLGNLVRELEPIVRKLIGDAAELILAVPDEPAIIVADKRRVEQAIVNLVINARDAAGDSGRISIGVELVNLDAPTHHSFGTAPVGRFVVLQVSDNGVGIDAANLPRVFEPFFTTKERGTGLGLAIVGCVMRQFGAAVTLDSEVGIGSTFKLYFSK